PEKRRLSGGCLPQPGRKIGERTDGVPHPAPLLLSLSRIPGEGSQRNPLAKHLRPRCDGRVCRPGIETEGEKSGGKTATSLDGRGQIHQRSAPGIRTTGSGPGRDRTIKRKDELLGSPHRLRDGNHSCHTGSAPGLPGRNPRHRGTDEVILHPIHRSAQGFVSGIVGNRCRSPAAASGSRSLLPSHLVVVPPPQTSIWGKRRGRGKSFLFVTEESG